mmetsp:Transcript_51060/g.158154  ORF Transcript_51060/g.158154 Transcript_51060/m.158154 type:complete len:204 (-) Transcript_51060:280-891(-)
MAGDGTGDLEAGDANQRPDGEPLPQPALRALQLEQARALQCPCPEGVELEADVGHEHQHGPAGVDAGGDHLAEAPRPGCHRDARDQHEAHRRQELPEAHKTYPNGALTCSATQGVDDPRVVMTDEDVAEAPRVCRDQDADRGQQAEGEEGLALRGPRIVHHLADRRRAEVPSRLEEIAPEVGPCQEGVMFVLVDTQEAGKGKA